MSRDAEQDPLAGDPDEAPALDLGGAIPDSFARESYRIKRELHDGIGQQLTGLGFLAERLYLQLQARRLPEAEAANELVEGIQHTLGCVRTLLGGIAIEEEVDPHWLPSWLEGMASYVKSRRGIPCHLSCEPPVRIEDGRTATQLWHIAKEAVTNALKHSGARTILIRLGSSDGRCSLQVQDDGRGIAAGRETSQGLGLRIMRERAEIIGATLSIRSSAAGGTLVTCLGPAADPREAASPGACHGD